MKIDQKDISMFQISAIVKEIAAGVWHDRITPFYRLPVVDQAFPVNWIEQRGENIKTSSVIHHKCGLSTLGWTLFWPAGDNPTRGPCRDYAELTLQPDDCRELVCVFIPREFWSAGSNRRELRIGICKGNDPVF